MHNTKLHKTNSMTRLVHHPQLAPIKSRRT